MATPPVANPLSALFATFSKVSFHFQSTKSHTPIRTTGCSSLVPPCLPHPTKHANYHPTGPDTCPGLCFTCSTSGTASVSVVKIRNCSFEARPPSLLTAELITTSRIAAELRNGENRFERMASRSGTLRAEARACLAMLNVHALNARMTQNRPKVSRLLKNIRT